MLTLLFDICKALFQIVGIITVLYICWLLCTLSCEKKEYKMSAGDDEEFL